MSFSVCIFVICSMSNVGQIQANLRKNAAEMSFVILEMSFGVWEMSFTHFWEMSFTRNAQKKSLKYLYGCPQLVGQLSLY